MPVALTEIMTEGVVTASPEDSVRAVAELMRDNNVGSVVLVNSDGRPLAMVTDRDLTVSALAAGSDGSERIAEHCTQPAITAEPQMELEEAAALMVQNHIRRLPVVDDDKIVGIVTLDDIAIRTGNLEVAKQMTREVVEAALPGYYFKPLG